MNTMTQLDTFQLTIGLNEVQLVSHNKYQQTIEAYYSCSYLQSYIVRLVQNWATGEVVEALQFMSHLPYSTGGFRSSAVS